MFSLPSIQRRSTNRFLGFTVTELIVTMAIISVLASLLAPAVQYAREAARKISCVNNLKQLGIAIHNYESSYGCLPAGLDHKYSLLPSLDYVDLYSKRNYAGRASHTEWTELNRIVVPIYLCPSDLAPQRIGDSNNQSATTNYAACSGTGIQRDGFNGMFNLGFDYLPSMPGGYVRLSEITDGLSNTAAMAEILHAVVSYDDVCTERLRAVWDYPNSLSRPDQLDDFADACDSLPPRPADYGYIGLIHKGVPWPHGDSGVGMYNHILGPNRPSCTNGGLLQYGCYSAASFHGNGVNVLIGDGHVRYLSNSIDRAVWRELGSRCSSAMITSVR